MFIIWGFGHRTIKSFGNLATDKCARCNNEINRQILKVTNWFTLFFIPLLPYKKEYLLVCPICSNAIPLTKEEFEKLTADNDDKVFISGNIVNANKYAGKTETQIAYLTQMEEIRQQRADSKL